MHLSTVLVTPQGFVMLDRFTASDAIEDFPHLGVPLGRDDDIDTFADGFGGGKSKQAFGGAVPAGDGAVKRLGDDGVVGRIPPPR